MKQTKHEFTLCKSFCVLNIVEDVFVSSSILVSEHKLISVHSYLSVKGNKNCSVYFIEGHFFLKEDY